MRSPAAATRLLLVGFASVVVAWVSQLTFMVLTAAVWWVIGSITRRLVGSPLPGSPVRGFSGVLIAMGGSMVDWTSSQVVSLFGSAVVLISTPSIAVTLILALAVALALSLTAGRRGFTLLDVPTRIERITIQRLLVLSALAMPVLWGTYYAIILLPGVFGEIYRLLNAFGQSAGVTGSGGNGVFAQIMIGGPLLLIFVVSVFAMAFTHALVVRTALRHGTRCGRCGYAFARRADRCSECGASVAIHTRPQRRRLLASVLWTLRATKLRLRVYALVLLFHIALVLATGLTAYAAHW